MKYNRRIVYVATSLVILVTCALVSVFCMPVYYYLLDASAPAAAVPALVKRVAEVSKRGVKRLFNSRYSVLWCFCARMTLSRPFQLGTTADLTRTLVYRTAD
jgi:hypothetical protein